MTQPDLPQARRQLISERLARGKPVVSKDLAVEFGLSEDAIRRDLRALAAEGLCKRVYGGAVPNTGPDRPIAARLHEASDQKLALARVAATTIAHGELVFLDNGSSNAAMVEFIAEDAGITVATNSVDIAAAVLRRQDIQLLLLGGEVDRHIGGCVDAIAIEALSRMRIDRCFLGVCAVSSADGLMASHFSDAHFKRALVQNSTHLCTLMTKDKLLATGAHRIGALSCLQTAVIEQGADETTIKALVEAGVEVIQVETAA
jgi:DeoR/GlpR family transcriptional regulator of sugar metabolism